MKQGACETYQQELLEWIEGGLAAYGQNALREHLERCPGCAAELSQLEALRLALETLGSRYNAAQVLRDSLVDSVLAEAEALQQAELVAYVEGAQAGPERTGTKQRLMLHESLRAEHDALQDMHQALSSYADASTAPALPDIDLVGVVMAEVSAMKAASGVDELRERRELNQIEDALQALGEAIIAATPPVDLVDAVMQSVPQAAPAARIVPLKTRPKREQVLRQPNSFRRLAWMPAAVAACALLTLGLLLVRSEQQSITSGPETRMASTSPVDQDFTATHTSGVTGGLTGEPGILGPEGRPQPQAQTPPKLAQHEQRRARYESTSLQNVLNARRKAMMKDAEALASMAEWSTLTEEEARALLEKLAWSTDAVLGASQFLSPEEAAAVLQAAIASKPEDPYLRYALARNLEELQRFDEGREQLAAWSGIDPDNSLAHYMDADLLFQQGQAEEALAMLDLASAMARASVYTSESAQHHRQALIANGMDPEVASVIAASTAGTNEYSDLVTLGEELLNYGKQYEAAGDYTTAEQIYNAVQQLGMQLDQNAAYGNIRLAGTDIQMDAVGALMNLYGVMGSPEGQYLLESAYDVLVNSLSEIGNIFNDYTQLFDSLSSDELMDITNLIVNEGDASVYPTYFYPQR